MSALLISSGAWAQYGTSSGSLSANRSNGIQSPEQVIIEDYMNYHRHDIPLPRSREDLNLSALWASDHIHSDGRALLQIGLATKAYNPAESRNVNVCLVIDQSGSMGGDGKLDKVKRALEVFLQQFRPDDQISVVAYADRAFVVSDPSPASRKNDIMQAIDQLYPGGSTNLSGGLLLGCEQVMKNWSAERTNRVILLTDGIANVGMTGANEIMEAVGKYISRGIEISTIGVGNDLNFSLLRQLADDSRGLNHFVGSHEEDISKVFVMEAKSLMSVLGRSVRLTVHYPLDQQVPKVYGYELQYFEGGFSIDLPNINQDLTQVFLIEWRLNNGADQNFRVSYALEYEDAGSGRMNNVSGQTKINSRPEAGWWLENQRVRKNYFIAYMADCLKAWASHRNTNTGWSTVNLNMCIDYVEHDYELANDGDVRRVLDILKNHAPVLPSYSANPYGP